ncbi:MAG: hypothetical protein M1834_007526 [Cirrosporium novae-zelandiae]|nr:MAG: hypothetical protein M1834_007526 [Cirrosporium novae-zelandiae]
MSQSTDAALTYHEPDIITILVQSSFLLLLNIINHVFDKLIYCGLIGEILIGVAWGIPGTRWLSSTAEEVIVQLGYLGLILLVYEGGLSTDFISLKANAILSTAVAITGISLPIAFSFSLRALTGATTLQSFAAGAALCSTSLGTTFTILGTTGLTKTRLGTVLSSAAMMDDVVGLIMVQVISNLGQSASALKAVTIIKPIMVSFALVIVLVLVCRFILMPLHTRIPDRILNMVFKQTYSAFFVHTSILFGLVSGATFAGTSGLFAAYLAGASISWWDLLVSSKRDSSTSDQPGVTIDEGADDRESSHSSSSIPPTQQQTAIQRNSTGISTYETYYSVVVSKILKPFFFVSIGFAIPVTKMFTKNIIWRSVIYAILMHLGKLMTALWLIRFSVSLPSAQKFLNIVTRFPKWCCWLPKKWQAPLSPSKQEPQQDVNAGELHPRKVSSSPEHSQSTISHVQPTPQQIRRPIIGKPRSLYPASILGSAMVSRGEIGFLIASLAETTGIFSSDPLSSGNSKTYLVVIWAIVLCTITGPITVGTLVKRVNRLQRERQNNGGVDPLGSWGVI